MADQKRVELILGIKTTGTVDASKGIESIGTAADNLRGELSKLERADLFVQLGRTAAVVAAETGDLTAATKRLADELFYVGASEAEIRKVSKAFEDTTKSIEKAQQAQIDATLKAEQAQAKKDERAARDAEKLRATQEKLGAAMAADIEKSRAAAEKLGEEQAIAGAKTREAANGASTLQKSLGQIARAEQIERISSEMGLLAKKTKDEAAAVAELNKQLKELGASDDEIRNAAGSFSAAQGGGPTNRLGRIGSELRALPSTQIPGLSISSDQVGGLFRLGGAITGISEKAAEATRVGALLTPVLGSTAAGFAAATLAAAPFVLAFGAILLAIKALGDQAAAEAKAINSIVDAQRKVAQDIANGLTTDEAQQQIKELNAQREAEAKILARNQQIYKENIENQGPLTAVLKATSGAEQALAEQIDKSKDIITANETATNALTQAMEDGVLAANDAAEAEKKLAEQRSKSALADADNEGKKLQAEQRALNATEEQNRKRLDTIEDERAVIEKQISVLEESGVTSDEVTKKIADLKDQLGLLGDESDFINDTALEASRKADAAKKAQKDAEDAAKKAEQAQQQYTKSVQNAGTQLRQSIQDIGTRFTQTLSDNELKFNRDLTDIATKYRRDEYDLEIKAYRSERDAAQDQVKDLKKIQDDANKDEQDALREGDFKALFLARQQREETLKEQQTTLDDEKYQREQSAQDAREDLLRNAQRQRQDRMVGYDRQLTDAQTARNRELEQARLTQRRALQAASEALNAELGMRQQFWNAVLKQTENALNQVSGLSMKGPNMPANTPQPMVFKAMRGVISR